MDQDLYAPNTPILVILGGIFGAIGYGAGKGFVLDGIAEGDLGSWVLGMTMLLLFAVPGGLALAWSMWSLARLFLFWRYGLAANAEVAAVATYKGFSNNGQYLTWVRYRYSLDGVLHSSVDSSWDDRAAGLRPATAITVLVNPLWRSDSMWVLPEQWGINGSGNEQAFTSPFRRWTTAPGSRAVPPCPQCGRASVHDTSKCAKRGAPSYRSLARAAAREEHCDATVEVGPAPRSVGEVQWRLLAPALPRLLMRIGLTFGVAGTGVGIMMTGDGLFYGRTGSAIAGPIVFVVGGLGGFYACARGVAGFLRARRLWRTGTSITAEVVSSQLRTGLTLNGIQPVRVTYTYSFNGQNLQGEDSWWDMRAIVLPPDTRITVIVNREQPAESLWLPPLE